MSKKPASVNWDIPSNTVTDTIWKRSLIFSSSEPWSMRISSSGRWQVILWDIEMILIVGFQHDLSTRSNHSPLKMKKNLQRNIGNCILMGPIFQIYPAAGDNRRHLRKTLESFLVSAYGECHRHQGLCAFKLQKSIWNYKVSKYPQENWTIPLQEAWTLDCDKRGIDRHWNNKPGFNSSSNTMRKGLVSISMFLINMQLRVLVFSCFQ